MASGERPYREARGSSPDSAYVGVVSDVASLGPTSGGYGASDGRKAEGFRYLFSLWRQTCKRLLSAEGVPLGWRGRHVPSLRRLSTDTSCIRRAVPSTFTRDWREALGDQ